MTDNNIEPIDPATCDSSKWWLVQLKPDGPAWPAWRADAGRWHLIAYTAAFHDAEVTVLAELVRADEAQAEASHLHDAIARWKAKAADNARVASSVADQLTSANAECDRLRVECEKAQTERDEATAERGEWQTAFADLERQHDELRQTTTELRTELTKAELRAKIGAAVDPDPTSASRLPELPERTDDNAPLLRYAADIMERTNGVAPCIRESIAALRLRASNLEAVSAREQERDAEIAAVAEAIDNEQFKLNADELERVTKAAIASIDAYRNERGQ